MDANADLAKLALDYHAYPTPGKISVVPTKTLANQDDLSLAYSPGVASACMVIHAEGEHFEHGLAENVAAKNSGTSINIISDQPML